MIAPPRTIKCTISRQRFAKLKNTKTVREKIRLDRLQRKLQAKKENRF